MNPPIGLLQDYSKTGSSCLGLFGQIYTPGHNAQSQFLSNFTVYLSLPEFEPA